MNLWKDVETFTNDGELLSVIEITKDTNVKYEYHVDYGLLVLDRCLISAMRYPCNYGFIPRTIGEDGDPLDIIVYTGVPLVPGCVVNGKVLGALDMEDKGKKDYKILIVPSFNRRYIACLQDIDKNYLAIVSDFFNHYKNVSGNEVKVNGWIEAEETLNIIKKGMAKYKKYSTKHKNKSKKLASSPLNRYT